MAKSIKQVLPIYFDEGREMFPSGDIVYIPLSGISIVYKDQDVLRIEEEDNHWFVITMIKKIEVFPDEQVIDIYENIKVKVT